MTAAVNVANRDREHFFVDPQHFASIIEVPHFGSAIQQECREWQGMDKGPYFSWTDLMPLPVRLVM